MFCCPLNASTLAIASALASPAAASSSLLPLPLAQPPAEAGNSKLVGHLWHDSCHEEDRGRDCKINLSSSRFPSGACACLLSEPVGSGEENGGTSATRNCGAGENLGLPPFHLRNALQLLLFELLTHHVKRLVKIKRQERMNAKLFTWSAVNLA